MSMLTRRLVAAGFFLYGLGPGCPMPAAADTPAQPVEVLRQMPKAVEDIERAAPEALPLPQELRPEELIGRDLYWFHPPTRINRYDVWRFYEVGHYGQFRPRVIYSAYGSFYLYDGRPFPWISTHQLDFLPVLIGP